MNPIFSQTCVCGRTFTDLGGFTRHEKGCRKGKKRLSDALNKAKEAHQAKRTRLSLSRSCPAANSNKEATSSVVDKGKARQGQDDAEDNEQATQQAWYHIYFHYFPSHCPIQGVSSSSLHQDQESPINTSTEHDTSVVPEVRVRHFKNNLLSDVKYFRMIHRSRNVALAGLVGYRYVFGTRYPSRLHLFPHQN